MTTTQIIQTILEFLIFIAIVLGFIFEDKLINFEDKIIQKLKRR